MLAESPKAFNAAELFRTRLDSGAYRLKGIPGERKLAADLGISYMSARKVVQHLLAERVLRRSVTGRLELAGGQRQQQGLQIGFVAPAFAAQVIMELQYDLTHLVNARGGIVRPVTYVQPSDPIIFEAIEGDFDGLFVILPVGAPQLLIDRLAKARDRVVILWQDMSHLGLLSIVTGPSRFIGKALDHLMALGHDRVDCINTLPHEPIVQDRMRHWRLGIEQRGLGGELTDEPSEAFGCSITAAYETFKRMIDRGLRSTAYFCSTTELGRGVLRACHEAGIRVGQDISVCGYGELSVAKLTVPSLTAVEIGQPRPLLAMGLEWIATCGEDWQRPMRLEPDDVNVFVGESTGPAIMASRHV